MYVYVLATVSNSNEIHSTTTLVRGREKNIFNQSMQENKKFPSFF